MPRKARELGATSFPDYIVKLEEWLRRPGRLLGLKASCTQLAMLHRYGALDMFPWTKVIHIHRDDLVAQAVSFHIAARTNQWTSRQERNDVPISYDFADIRNRFNGLANDDRRIAQICSALSLEVVHVRYEDLVARPREEIAKILDFFGTKLDAKAVLEPTIEKQADAMNDELAQRFREDWLGSQGIEPPSSA
jgi:LPS sulfotransferase NodH